MDVYNKGSYSSLVCQGVWCEIRRRTTHRTPTLHTAPQTHWNLRHKQCLSRVHLYQKVTCGSSAYAGSKHTAESVIGISSDLHRLLNALTH
jgi:hypothetical protein